MKQNKIEHLDSSSKYEDTQNYSVTTFDQHHSSSAIKTKEVDNLLTCDSAQGKDSVRQER